MFVDGQKMVGSELQQSKLQNCIQEELYLHIVGYSCVNFADSMSFLPMEVSINEGSGQGSVCSPVISCVYMHYVLVWWFKEVITPKLKVHCISANCNIQSPHGKFCFAKERQLFLMLFYP